jgi:transposase
MEVVMVQVRFTEEFRQEAVRQVVERGHPVAEVAARLGVSQHSLYAWLKKHRKPAADTAAQAEVKRLQAELRRVTEERDILKKAAAYFARESR